MRASNITANVRARGARSSLIVHGTIAPSKPQQATARKTPSVNAKVNYVKPAAEGEELFTYLYEKPENVSTVTNLEHIETEVPFIDLRTVEDQEGQFTLERNGFQLEQLHVPSDIDWTDDDKVGFTPTRTRCCEVPVVKLAAAAAALFSLRTHRTMCVCNQVSLSHRLAACILSVLRNDLCLQQVAARYYPEVEALLKQVAGASRVHIFDHTIRMGSAK